MIWIFRLYRGSFSDWEAKGGLLVPIGNPGIGRIVNCSQGKGMPRRRAADENPFTIDLVSLNSETYQKYIEKGD